MDSVQYFTNLCLAAYVDGELDPKEVAILEKHAENLKLTSDQAQHVLNGVARGELKEFVRPKSPEARQAAFRAVVRILRADKKITRKERKMIIILGNRMDIDDETIDKALSPSSPL
jgi:uncharacterized tellurite resistance protein B-like protein